MKFCNVVSLKPLTRYSGDGAGGGFNQGLVQSGVGGAHRQAGRGAISQLPRSLPGPLRRPNTRGQMDRRGGDGDGCRYSRPNCYCDSGYACELLFLGAGGRFAVLSTVNDEASG